MICIVMIYLCLLIKFGDTFLPGLLGGASRGGRCGGRCGGGGGRKIIQPIIIRRTIIMPMGNDTSMTNGTEMMTTMATTMASAMTTAMAAGRYVNRRRIMRPRSVSWMCDSSLCASHHPHTATSNQWAGHSLSSLNRLSRMDKMRAQSPSYLWSH